MWRLLHNGLVWVEWVGLFMSINGIFNFHQYQQCISPYTGKDLASLPPQVSRVSASGWC